MQQKIERALFSVSDKSGLEGFARTLADQGVEILATGGTYQRLHQAGIAVREVSQHTGFPEMMDGRVKTLHPKVHGGILALRDESSHVAAMNEHGILPIDLVCVNLYPFEETVAKRDVVRAEAVEQIDIGGPSMVRSAAKNHRFVTVVTDPSDYGRVLDAIERGAGATSEDLRRELAVKAFGLTARYDAAISTWLFEEEQREGKTEEAFPASYSIVGLKELDLRYGENPHQKAAFYRQPGADEASVGTAEFLGGKALSYNNLVDLDAALALAKEFREPFVCVCKHNNPCGAASAPSLADALSDAWDGDPLSAFGSVLAFTRPVDLACAAFLTEGGRFVEAIIAPGFDEDALDCLRTKPKWGRNVRLLSCGAVGPDVRQAGGWEAKPLTGGFLLQSRNLETDAKDGLKVVTRKEPAARDLQAALFASAVGKHVKSNAIVLAHGTKVVGVGAGQMSRVDSVELACRKAGERVQGSALASDAFFPFPDGVQAAARAGVTTVLQPGGSMRDEKVIAACDELGVAMVFTGRRHFRH